jgi:hypothetical protein
MRKFLSRLKSDASGNILMIAGAGIMALVGAAGIGVDTVQWYLWKRQMQQATDSGALAGALNLSQGHGYLPAAQSELLRTANTLVSIESITNPPATGAFAGDNRAVEVIATTSRALPFSGLFLASAPIIRARSVAASVAGDEHCVIALSDTGIGVNVRGTANVKLGCGVAANSRGSSSVYLQGASLLSASPISSAGGITFASGNIDAGTALQPYGQPVTDPMASRELSVPTSPSVCRANNLVVSPQQNVTLLPGRYCGGMALKGTVTLAPGVYIVDGGTFTAESQATIVGEGVTIILTGADPTTIANVEIAGTARVDLRAPTAIEDPKWQGVLFYQDPRGSTKLSTVSGGSNLLLAGIVYLPKGDLVFGGGGGQRADCLLLVANKVDFSGVSSIDNDCSLQYDDFDVTSRIIRVVE